MKARRFILLIVLIGYGFLFFQVERTAQQIEPRLSLPMPVMVQKLVLGFLRQLGGEISFIKTSVFLGGLDPAAPKDAHADSLVRNFNVMAGLHPDFIDIYFLCEASLPDIDQEKAREANDVLAIGMQAHPEKWYLPYFIGFNHFYYLQENREAADNLLHAASLPGGAPWLAHLASILAAEGGDIIAGLTWLKAMLQTETDPSAKARYRNDIAAFEQAYTVQMAVNAFKRKYGKEPPTLETLIPEFLSDLPDFKGKFLLHWNPPILRMERLLAKQVEWSKSR